MAAKKVKIRPKEVMNVELTTTNIVSEVAKETNLPEDIVRRIILFLNFSIYTKEGNLTSFAKKYGIKDYKDLYKTLELIKENYKNDREVVAFSEMYNSLAKSVYLRAAAWIFNTFVKMENDMDQKEKYFTSGLYSVSFTNRTFGQVMENLKVFKKVLNTFDKYKSVVQEFSTSQKFQKQNEDEAEEK